MRMYIQRTQIGRITSSCTNYRIKIEWGAISYTVPHAASTEAHCTVYYNYNDPYTRINTTHTIYKWGGTYNLPSHLPVIIPSRCDTYNKLYEYQYIIQNT